MERFVIIVNGFQPLTIITKRSILDIAAVLETIPIYSLSLVHSIKHCQISQKFLRESKKQLFRQLKLSNITFSFDPQWI